MDLASSTAIASDLEAELIEAYPALTRRLALVLRDSAAAEDVAQSAFARAIERRHAFRGGNARAWFMTIALRLAFNELRRQRRSPTRPLEVEPAWAMTLEPDLWIALGQLEPIHRAALLLSTLDGYTHEEIGRMLGVRPGTISSWLSRSKARLREVLGDDDG